MSCHPIFGPQLEATLAAEAAPWVPFIPHIVTGASTRSRSESPKPIPISQSPQFVSDTDFTAAILNSTNLFRHQHNASAVNYNATLDQFATAYLDANADCTFAHSGGPYGENIALGCSDVQGCVDAWGNERAKYDFDHPDFGQETGHFTQLVWKNTTAVGCGRKLCGDKGWFLVCEYFPRGNVLEDQIVVVSCGKCQAAGMPSSCDDFVHSDEYLKKLVDAKKKLDVEYDQAVAAHRDSLAKLQRVEAQRRAVEVKAIRAFTREAEVLSLDCLGIFSSAPSLLVRQLDNPDFSKVGSGSA
ncbi:CAP domain-containing protein [Cercophora scortea]|uniref:CAP domain-containing protein n=1 Tax=Cercophora scortea TaxID=314031 RepID=A0AAE0IXF1_9PEZI|nr:CAP domain-containing protein [Cercophora scortea]